MAAITLPEGGSTSFLSTLTSMFLPTAHAEEAHDDDENHDKDEAGGEKDEAGGEKEEGGDDKGEGGDEHEDEGEEKEEGGDGDEEEEEPEDPAPDIRKECEETQCVEPAKHFKLCAERVQGGKGFQHEDCVEELFHMMHCVDACAAPKIFKRLV